VCSSGRSGDWSFHFRKRFCRIGCTCWLLLPTSSSHADLIIHSRIQKKVAQVTNMATEKYAIKQNRHKHLPLPFLNLWLRLWLKTRHLEIGISLILYFNASKSIYVFVKHEKRNCISYPLRQSYRRVVRTTATGRILPNFGRYTYGGVCCMCFKHDGAYCQFCLQLESSLTIISLRNAQACNCLQLVSPVSRLENYCVWRWITYKRASLTTPFTYWMSKFKIPERGQYLDGWSPRYTAVGNAGSATHTRVLNTVASFPKNARAEAVAQDRTCTLSRDLPVMCRQRNACFIEFCMRQIASGFVTRSWTSELCYSQISVN
jgi:hypothetical protein